MKLKEFINKLKTDRIYQQIWIARIVVVFFYFKLYYEKGFWYSIIVCSISYGVALQLIKFANRTTKTIVGGFLGKGGDKNGEI